MIQTVLDFWKGLDSNLQALLIGTAGQFFGSLSVDKWNCLKGDAGQRVMAAVYQRWQEGLLKDVRSAQLHAAFEDFFGREETRYEMGKLLRGEFAFVDFERLEAAVRASCEWAKCPVPNKSLLSLLEGLVAQLVAELESEAAGDPDAAALRQTLSKIRERDPDHRNHSLARQAYLRKVANDYSVLRLIGFEKPADAPEPKVRDVFVMPRVVRADRNKEDDKGKPASSLLTKNARKVLLGKPGAGKSTLMKRLALGMATGEEGYPDLLPVLYRALDYHDDREEYKHDLPGCLQARLEKANVLLPKGFFERQIQDGGIALLIDGLDEVTDEGERVTLVNDVEQFISRLPSGSLALITSRPKEYDKTPIASSAYARHELQDFNPEEISQFILKWRGLRAESASAAAAATRDLEEEIGKQQYLQRMAPNPLLLTMICCVHLWGGGLPESRVELYRICTRSLERTWRAAAGVDVEGMDLTLTIKFLGQVAFDMQTGDHEKLSSRQDLDISETELTNKLVKFLKDWDPSSGASDIMKRFELDGGILVHIGNRRFAFQHRSFQEYCAAVQMASEMSWQEIAEKIDVPGWQETVALAAALLPEKEARPMLLRLLKESRAEQALLAMSAMPKRNDWLATLVRFLAKRTWDGRKAGDMPASDCIFEQGRKETLEILEEVLDKNRRDGQVMAAAVELAEELRRRGDQKAQGILDGFFAKGEAVERETMAIPTGPFLSRREKELVSVDVAAFEMDRFPVTNAEYEQMVPGHAQFRNHEYEGRRISDGDNDPVILVSWHEAALYARWTGGRLPTSDEWEKAAAWGPEFTEPREYPWGPWDEKRAAALCNTSERKLGRTTPVDTHPEGRSAYGCEDMAGNVWEWTSTPRSWGLELRGGSWNYGRVSARCAARFDGFPEYRYYFGFRCART